MEKSYEEALERAKKYLGDCMLTRQEYAERIFPELKESKDERIRKGLIEYFQAGKCANINSYYGISTNDILYWLKKQDEQKPADKVEPKFKVGDWVIVHNKDAYQVIGVNTYDYRLQHYLGGEMDYPFKYETDLKPWTIQSL